MSGWDSEDCLRCTTRTPRHGPDEQNQCMLHAYTQNRTLYRTTSRFSALDTCCRRRSDANDFTSSWISAVASTRASLMLGSNNNGGGGSVGMAHSRIGYPSAAHCSPGGLYWPALISNVGAEQSQWCGITPVEYRQQTVQRKCLGPFQMLAHLLVAGAFRGLFPGTLALLVVT